MKTSKILCFALVLFSVSSYGQKKPQTYENKFVAFYIDKGTCLLVFDAFIP